MSNRRREKWKGSPVGGLFFLAALLLSGVGARGQVRATPPRVYRVPTTGGAARFRVPQVQLADAAVARRINAALTRLLLTANLADTTPVASASQAIRRARAEYEANQQVGVFGTSYDVLLNQAGLLSLALHWEYSGAYPYTATRHATFDVHTGRRLVPADLLRDTLALRQQWHQRIEERLRAYRRELAADATADPAEWAVVCEYTGWDDTTQHLLPTARPQLNEFALTSRGLVLYTEFSFPHAVQSLAPESDYLFTYAALGAWLKQRSLVRGLKEK